MTEKQRNILTRILYASYLFILVLAVSSVTKEHKQIVSLLYLFPYLTVGGSVLIKAVKNVFKGQVFDEKLLMAVATVGAICIGEMPEAVFVMLFYQVGELFESLAVGKSRKSIAELMEMTPQTVRLIRNGSEQEVTPEEAQIGETMLVRAGERIGLDGTVTCGASSIDTSSLTGESVPVTVQEGANVLSGSVSLDGTLWVRVDKPFYDSTASRIMTLVTEAASKKAKNEDFITKFARYYTPAVVFAALLLAFVPPIFLGGLSGWVGRALNLLVISCPCALIISVPLTFFSGLGSASRKGILIKGSGFVELLAGGREFVFDKTGTLTVGKIGVKDVFALNGDKNELLRYAEALERYSNHPIAAAIRSAYSGDDPLPCTDHTEIAGKGVFATSEGKGIYGGTLSYLNELGVQVPSYNVDGTVLYLALEKEFIGYVTFTDSVKEGAAEALSDLKRLSSGRITVLTGDNEASATKVCAEIEAIDSFKASLLPEGKVKALREILDGGNGAVVFVGDGMNDAPVLKLADVGVAMGGIGSDAAIEASDVVIVDDNVSKISTAVRICRKTMSIVKQNIAFSIAVKLVIMLASVLGFCPMYLAVFADVGVMTVAVVNSLRAMKE